MSSKVFTSHRVRELALTSSKFTCKFRFWTETTIHSFEVWVPFEPERTEASGLLLRFFYFFSISRHRITISILFVPIYYLYFSVILGLPLKLKLQYVSILLLKYIVSIHSPRWFSHEREKELLNSLRNGHRDNRPESCKVIHSKAGSRKLLCLHFSNTIWKPLWLVTD